MRRFNLLLVILSVSCVVLSSPARTAQSTDRARLLAEIESLREQLKAREQEYLSPAAEDRAAFAEFLASPDTGLIRLLPRPRSKEESKVSIPGGGAYYSFHRKTHEYGYGSDLELQNGYFIVGFAGADYGLLASIGDVPLEAVNLETPGAAFLSSMATPFRLAEAREQQRRSNDGFEQGGIVYKRQVPAVVGNTYLLRSINYDESDILIGFRVVRKDSDGSLILLWKMLRQFPGPTLVRDGTR
ncbi:MAG TPA: hypothetical protein VNO14_14190 [Blastocatellia bacterium]|nr:hypothetical protein [Blastocatellia bacterium]